MAVTNSPQLQSTPNISRIPPSNIAPIPEVWKILRNNTRKQAFLPPESTLDIDSNQLAVLLSFRLPQHAWGEEIRSRNTSKMWPLGFTSRVQATIVSIIMSYPSPPHRIYSRLRLYEQGSLNGSLQKWETKYGPHFD